MPFEVLQKDDELFRYSKSIYPLIGIALPLEYLKRSKVVIYRSRNGAIIAGYSIALNPPFRSLLPVPGTNEFISHAFQRSMAELNGIWIARENRKGFFCNYVLVENDMGFFFNRKN